MSRHRINYALAATLVTNGLTFAQAAKEVGAKNANVLAVGLRRKGVTASIARQQIPVGERNVSITMRLASQASEVLRQGFADILQNGVSKLKNVQIGAKLSDIKELAEVVEPLARTAKIVHNWGEESSATLDMSGVAFNEPIDIPQPVVNQERLVCDEPQGEINNSLPNT